MSNSSINKSEACKNNGTNFLSLILWRVKAIRSLQKVFIPVQKKNHSHRIHLWYFYICMFTNMYRFFYERNQRKMQGFVYISYIAPKISIAIKWSDGAPKNMALDSVSRVTKVITPISGVIQWSLYFQPKRQIVQNCNTTMHCLVPPKWVIFS